MMNKQNNPSVFCEDSPDKRFHYEFLNAPVSEDDLVLMKEFVDTTTLNPDVYDQSLEKLEYLWARRPKNICSMPWIWTLKYWEYFSTIHPAALEKLQQHKDETLASFESTLTLDDWKTSIYLALILKQEEQILESFLKVYNKNKILALEFYPDVEDQIIEKKMWDVYGTYLDNPLEEYKGLFQDLIGWKKMPSFQRIENWDYLFIQKISNMLIALKHTMQMVKANEISKQIIVDMSGTKFARIARQIFAQAQIQPPQPIKSKPFWKIF